MHCTEEENKAAPRRAALGLLSGLAALGAAVGASFVAGCAAPGGAPAPAGRAPAPAPSTAPQPAPAAPPAAAPAPPRIEQAPPPPAPAAAPRKPVDLGPKVKLAPPPAVRNWDEFRKMAARRMVTASPKFSYMSKPQPLLFGIPVMEIELNADGSVREISVTRPPANIDAQDTIDYAIAAIQRAAPFGDISRLPKPWKFTEVFLFNSKRQFKPRSLD